MTIIEAKHLFKKNFIGADELNPFFKAFGLGEVEIQEKTIQYRDADLQKAANKGYILVYEGRFYGFNT